ncbi:tail protein [Cyanophage S-2L]|nr:tail protein [Cyanophage S-2L]
MSFAPIRAILEGDVAAAVDPVSVVFDNTFETPPSLPYVRFTVSFDAPTSDAIGGGMASHVTGVVQANVYVAKMTGSLGGELLAAKILDAWQDLAAAAVVPPGWRVVPRSLEGPQTLAPDKREAHVVVVGAAFSATLYETP